MSSSIAVEFPLARRQANLQTKHVAFKKRAEKVYDESALYEYAVGALGRKMRTVAELKRLMRQRVMRQPNGDELIEAVVLRLKDQKYLNDTNYAVSYSNYRKENEKFGRLRVIQDLKIKGVHGDVIEKAVGAAYDGVREDQLARDFLSRKRVKEPKDQKEAARIFRMLARAGFSSRASVSILKHWNVDDETVSALEQERAEAEDSAKSDET